MSCPSKIKTITTKTPVWKDNITCIWLSEQNPETTWSRWNGICVGADDFEKWSGLDAYICCLVVKEDNAIERILGFANQVETICATKATLAKIPAERWKTSFSYIIQLDDLTMFPFLNCTWDGTYADAVAIAAQLFRFRRIVDWSGSDRRKTVLEEAGIKLVSHIVPEKVHLITQYFRPENKRRQKEIRKCLYKNIANSYIDKIILFNETDLLSEWKKEHGSDKIEQIIVGRRLRYSDFIQYALSAPPNVFVILANADIYMTETLSCLWEVNMADKMFSLLRWDEQSDDTTEPKLFGPTARSQDSWIVRTDSVHCRKWNMTTLNYSIGVPGCDNKFSMDMFRNRFTVSNPCYTIKTVHVHRDLGRSYTEKDILYADSYLYIEPTVLSPMHIVCDITADNGVVNTTDILNNPFSIQIRSSSISSAIVFCTMVSKGGRYTWEANIDNFHTDSFNVHKMNHKSVTSMGLMYDDHNMYVGSQEAANEYWSNTVINTFSPMQAVPYMLAIPVSDKTVFQDTDTYCLKYLSRALRLKKELGSEYSFFAPRDFVKTLVKFTKENRRLNAVPWTEDSIVYSQTVLGILPNSNSYELGSEDINILRESYSGWVKSPYSYEKKCVVQTTQTQTNIHTPFSLAFSEDLVKSLGEGWTIQFLSETDTGSDAYDKLIGASLFITWNEPKSRMWHKIWALPEDAYVLDFQNELNMDGELQHVAAAASLKSYVFPTHKAPIEHVQNEIRKIFQKWAANKLNRMTTNSTWSY